MDSRAQQYRRSLGLEHAAAAAAAAAGSGKLYLCQRRPGERDRRTKPARSVLGWWLVPPGQLHLLPAKWQR